MNLFFEEHQEIIKELILQKVDFIVIDTNRKKDEADIEELQKIANRK